MKLIFLDIDGVLVTPTSNTNYLKSKEEAEAYNFYRDESYKFSSDAIRNLRELVSRTGANVVIISQWRKTISIGKIIGMLNNAGFDAYRTVLYTLSWFCNEEKRSDEIKDFIRMTAEDGSDFRKFVIIDDSKDYEDYQLPHLVSPDPEKGFSSEDLEKAIKILEGTK